MKINYILFSTLFGIGKLTNFPGTLASFISLLFIWMIKQNLSASKVVILYLFFVLFSLFVVSNSLKRIKKKDPKELVIDEFIGQFTCLLFLPNKIEYYIIGFLLFRFFDIIKPYPIDKIDKRDDAIGVVFDDVLAGFFAGSIIHGLIYFIRI